MKTIYYNADIVTMDDNNPYAEVLWIEDGKIVKIGTGSELLPEDFKDKQIEKIFTDNNHGDFNNFSYIQNDIIFRDMQGKTILPGFIDGHSHIVTVSYDFMFANANPRPKGKCDSIDELVAELKKQYIKKEPSLKKGDWFIAMGYDESVYPDKKPPTKYDMDKICSDYPLCCTHASGHNAVFNSVALKLLGINDDYVVPAGGGMPKLSGTNEYSGLLQEQAFFMLQNHIKMPKTDDLLKALDKCVELYASYGITTAQNAKSDKRELNLLELAKKDNKLKIDIACYIDFYNAQEYLPKQNPYLNIYHEHVRYVGYKLFLDGSPQAKTAWLTKPYYKVPEDKNKNYCGFPLFGDEEIVNHLDTCLKNNWQVNVHTNGDAAIDQFIRCYKKALEANPRAKSLRPVFIHCQTVREDQLDEIAKLNMLISFFEDHVYYWGDFHYESVLGPKRAQHISPFASALKRGINCTLHQDTPVVYPNMLFAVHNAVNRRTKSGRVLGKDQCVSPYEALKAVTINGAYQLFEEYNKGSLEVGKQGDIVVLDGNPLKIDIQKIKDINILETIKAGNTIYSAK